ncbi:hypothetical protein GRI97_07640 [Altererythrobacter xixiisoli]|uniref:Uncharacterized protein n=1 Tax=Croceibacterium xixiisoli TaxID=1476466 RepID=A0A6I4TSD7_9SPHN|nr:hypothetical protein [Croceibacterium xixiisoli]MXO98856.1 hypothetical protein [Croceibacterium xixiisoli]
MSTISKALVGTVAAGAMAMASFTPAAAQSRDRDRGGIGAGEIIAGALIIGGIAAIAATAGNDRNDRRYNDRRGRGWDDRRGYNQDPRRAVEQCVRAAERGASSRAWRNGAKVTDIRDIRQRDGGYRITGRIAVNQMQRDWRRGDNRYGRGWGNDYRGWNDRYAGWDSGRFTCDVRYDQITRLNYNGIRGL